MRPGTPPASRPVKTTTKDADLIRDRRERLIRAAIKVFSEKGFHESTVRDISRAARLAEGTIYNYRRGKEDILFLVLPDDVHRSLIERHRDHSSLWFTLQDRTQLQAGYTSIGAFAYHFWMTDMTPSRYRNGNQHSDA